MICSINTNSLRLLIIVDSRHQYAWAEPEGGDGGRGTVAPLCHCFCCPYPRRLLPHSLSYMSSNFVFRQFLHTLENDQVLLLHPLLGIGVPIKIFFKGGSKIGLKCNVLAARTLEPWGVAS